MEEFKHMIVEEFTEEDFYETIEAPKFVDLTAPDHRPEGDDRYWFCSRVGCDQKHEEFMDSEAIYKNFVLRVMAARSPNIRLRKALYRKDSSVDPKCPNTVPAKPSRSRVSRLAMISSIPHKANNGNIKSKEAKVISSTNKNVTPKAKVRGIESSVVSSVPRKALTERKKQLRSPAPFRSVQNPRNATVRVSKNRIVAKALVFHSPKKVVKLKRSVEVRSSVKKTCSGIRKFDTAKKRNVLGFDLKVVSSAPSRKTLKVREVKSRVFDSLRVPKQIADKAKGATRSTLKQKVKEKEEHLHSSDTLKTNKNDQLEAREDIAVKKESGVDKSKEYQIAEIEEKENAVAMECKTNEAVREDLAVIKESGVVKAKQHETMETEDKENALPLECDEEENATNAANIDSDDKENLSALDNNRKVEYHSNPPVKKKVICRKETCKTTQKVMLVADKCLNGNTVSATTRVKYTKPKLTNPKPFRLRTDERQILKEANTEKKPKCALSKEEETTNILRSNGENLSPKHQLARLEKNTRGNDSREMSKKVVRHDASENMMNRKRVAFGTKKKAASKKNETMEETTPMKGEATVITNKHSVCAVGSGEKRLATVPKGPTFHSIHVPKSCTKRVASQV